MSISREEILRDDVKFDKSARSLFQQVDKNQSGFIDRSELRVSITRYCQENGIQEPSEVELGKVFKQIDTSQSGDIDFQEFKNYLKRAFSEGSSL